jgi:hypothetical protein
MEHAVAADQRAVADAARRIGQNPFLGSVRPYLAPPYRFWSLTRFGYVLVYDPQTDPVESSALSIPKRDLPRMLANLRDAPDGPGN